MRKKKKEKKKYLPPNQDVGVRATCQIPNYISNLQNDNSHSFIPVLQARTPSNFFPNLFILPFIIRKILDDDYLNLQFVIMLDELGILMPKILILIIIIIIIITSYFLLTRHFIIPKYQIQMSPSLNRFIVSLTNCHYCIFLDYFQSISFVRYSEIIYMFIHSMEYQ